MPAAFNDYDPISLSLFACTLSTFATSAIFARADNVPLKLPRTNVVVQKKTWPHLQRGDVGFIYMYIYICSATTFFLKRPQPQIEVLANLALCTFSHFCHSERFQNVKKLNFRTNKQEIRNCILGSSDERSILTGHNRLHFKQITFKNKVVGLHLKMKGADCHVRAMH